MDPYKVLRISPDASEDEVRKAYRKMAAKYHPDTGGEAWIFQQVQDAYKMITEGVEPEPPPQPQPKPKPQSTPVGTSDILDDSLSGSMDGSGSFTSKVGSKKFGRPKRARRIPKPAARRATTKSARRARAFRRRSQDETIKIAIFGVCALISFAVLAFGGMKGYEFAQKQGWIGKPGTEAEDDSGDNSGDGALSTNDDHQSQGESSTTSTASGTSSSGGTMSDQIQITRRQPSGQGNGGRIEEPEIGDTDSSLREPPNSEEAIDGPIPEMGSNNSTDLTDDPDDSPDKSSNLPDSTDEDDPDDFSPSAAFDFASIRINSGDQRKADYQTTTTGHAVKKVMSDCDAYDSAGSRKHNTAQAKRKILFAINRKADEFCLNVFLDDDGDVRTAKTKPQHTANCAWLGEILEYDLIKDQPLQFGIQVPVSPSEELIAKCISHANDNGLLSSDCPMIIRVPVSVDSLDDLASLLGRIPDRLRSALELVAVVPKEFDLLDSLSELRQIGFDEVSLPFQPSVVASAQRIQNTGMQVGLYGFESVLGSDPDENREDRDAMIHAFREIFDSIQFEQLNADDLKAIGETASIAHFESERGLESYDENQGVEGGYLVSTLLQLPDSIEDGSSQTIVSKYTQGKGFRLELVNPPGRGEDNAALQFSVGVGGRSDLYTSIPFKSLSSARPIHIVASCPGWAVMRISVDCGTVKSNDRNVNGWVVKNDVDVAVGQDHQSGSNFEGKIESLSVVALTN